MRSCTNPGVTPPSSSAASGSISRRLRRACSGKLRRPLRIRSAASPRRRLQLTICAPNQLAARPADSAVASGKPSRPFSAGFGGQPRLPACAERPRLSCAWRLTRLRTILTSWPTNSRHFRMLPKTKSKDRQCRSGTWPVPSTPWRSCWCSSSPWPSTPRSRSPSQRWRWPPGFHRAIRNRLRDRICWRQSRSALPDPAR